jgi:hypothetical protein
MFVAEREIWPTISRMLWAFDMTQVAGKPIDLYEYDGLSGRSPVAFEVTLRPRYEGTGEVLDREMGNGVRELHGVHSWLVLLAKLRLAPAHLSRR